MADLITVVGDFDALDGSPVSGKVTITPSVEFTRAGITYPQLPTTVTLDSEGKFTLRLPASDDDLVTPQGFTYKVDVSVTSLVDGRARTYVESKNIHLELADAAPVVDPVTGISRLVAQLADLIPAAAVGTPSVFVTRAAVAALIAAAIGDGGTVDLSGYATVASLSTVSTTATAAVTTASNAKTAADAAKAAADSAAAGVGAAQAAATMAQTTANTATSAAQTASSDAATATAAAQAASTLAATRAAQRPVGLTPFDIRMLDRRSQPINILSIGSSTVRGNQLTDMRNRFPDQLGQILHAAYNPVGAPGGRHSIAEVASDTGWSATGTVTAQTRGFALTSSSLATGASITNTFELTTSFEVQYAQGSTAGAFTVKIDDGTPVTVTPSSTGSLAHTGIWKSAALTRGTHTITITATTANAEINSVYAYDGDETLGIRSYVSGHGGYSIVDFNGTLGTTLRQRVAQIQPAIVILCWGSNDWKAGVAVTTMQSRLRTQISELTSVITGPVTFVLIAQAQRLQNLGTGDYAPYVAGIKAVAEEDPSTRVYVDCYTPFPTTLAGDTYSLVGPDGIHPSDRGQALITDIIQRALWVPSGATGKVAPATVTPAVPDTTAPTAPTSVNAVAGDSRATLTPTGSTDAVGIAGYRAYSAATGGSALVSGTSPLVVTGLANGTAYTFYVSAFDAAGNESARTASNSVTPAMAAATRPASSPATASQPTSWLRADQITGVADGGTLATWTANTGPSATTVTTNSGTSPVYRSTAGPASKPAVSFVKANKNKMQVALTNTPRNTTILGVVRAPSITDGGGYLFHGVTADASVAGRIRITAQITAGASAGYLSANVQSGTETGTAAGSMAINTWYVARVTYDSAGIPTASLNGTAVTGTVAVASASADALALGGFGTNSPSSTDYAEAIMIQGALTEAEAKQWEQYLGQTYGITVN